MTNSTTSPSSRDSNCSQTSGDCGGIADSCPTSSKVSVKKVVGNVLGNPSSVAARTSVTFPFIMDGFRENDDGRCMRIRAVPVRNGNSILFPFRPSENGWAGILIYFYNQGVGTRSSIRGNVRSALSGHRFNDSSQHNGAFLLKASVFTENDSKPIRQATVRLDPNTTTSPYLPIAFGPIPDSKGRLYNVALELEIAENQKIRLSLFRSAGSVTSCGSKIYRGVTPVACPYYCYSTCVGVRGRAAPLVSFLIVTYNAEGYLRKCLNSIADQHYPNIEIVVVDNASQDDTVRIIEEEFPYVKLLRMSANLDFCRGNNVGVPYCSGEYLFILNADTEIESHAVSTLVDAIEMAPYIAVAAPIISTKGSTTRYANVFLDRLVTGKKALLTENRLVAAPCGASFLVRSSVVKELGYLFDEDFVTNWEDHDFGLRCWLQGYVCVHVPEQLVWHVGGGVYGLMNFKRHRMIVRNELLTYFKNFPFLDFVKSFLLRTARAVRSLNELIGVFFFLRDFFKFIPERNRLQNGRKIEQRLFRFLASGAPYKT